MSLTTYLPDEVVIEVLLLLNARDLVRCRLVAQSWRKIIDTDDGFRYKLELHIAGMADANPDSVPFTDRLATLREHQKAWSLLTWTNTLSVPKEPWRVWDFYGNVLAQMVNANVIRFLHVPSSLRGIPESPPWDVRVGFPIIEFGMDPTTNLLILLEVVPTGQAVPHANRSRIHLATLSDGASHPGAQLSELELEIERYTHHWSYTIQTCGDLLGILYAHPRHEHTMGEYHLVIWDWRRGAIVTQVSGNDLESFTFLDHGRLMLGRIPQRIDHDLNGMQVHLELYSFEPLNQPDTTRPLRKLGVLKYPTTEEDVEFSHLNIRMDPAVAWRPPTTHNVPFHVGDEERIINIQWHGFCDSRAGPIIHFVHLKTVLDHVRRLEVESRQVEGDQFIDVPWKEWGPHGSRLWVDNLGISHNWLCYVYGSQWIYCERRRGIAGTAQPVWLTLRDFSSVGVRHAMFMGQLSGTGYKTAALGDGPDDCISFPGDNWSYILTDTVAKDYFVEPVTTSLPYRERFGMTPPDILPNGRVAPMLSEDAILLVQESDFGQIKILSF